jgi:hypothetical protein
MQLAARCMPHRSHRSHRPQTVHTDAASRTLCPAHAASHLISGEIGGLTLTPGLYKSTAGLTTTGDVTLDAQVCYFRLLSVTFGYFRLLSVTISYVRLLSVTFSYFRLL